MYSLAIILTSTSFDKVGGKEPPPFGSTMFAVHLYGPEWAEPVS